MSSSIPDTFLLWCLFGASRPGLWDAHISPTSKLCTYPTIAVLGDTYIESATDAHEGKDPYDKLIPGPQLHIYS